MPQMGNLCMNSPLKSKSSGKDDEGKLNGSQDSRMTFRAWRVRLDEQAVPFESMADLNEAYVRLLKDATRCTPAFPEFLRQWGGIYSFENFLATFKKQLEP
jgi:hypothetical protein